MVSHPDNAERIAELAGSLLHCIAELRHEVQRHRAPGIVRNAADAMLRSAYTLVVQAETILHESTMGQ